MSRFDVSIAPDPPTAETAVLVFCGPDNVTAIGDLLSSDAGEVQISERRNLDGSTAVSWVLVATVAIQSLPAILAGLKEFLRRDSVERLQIGELVIEKPRPEDVDAALGQHLSKSREAPKA